MALLGAGSSGVPSVWGTPTSVGTAGSNGSSAVLISSVTAPTGALMVVAVYESSNTAGSVADSASNTYTLASSSCASSKCVQLFYAYNITALASGTITYTRGGSVDNVAESAFYVTGEQTSSAPLDLVTTPTSASSQFPTITSGTAAVAGEFFVSVVGVNTTSFSITSQDTNHAWATPPVANNTNAFIGGASFVNPLTTALTYAPTLSSSQLYKELLISFKPTGGATYTGLGDIVSGTGAYWGLRAFSSATRGNKVANICTLVTAVDTCVDMSSDATTGALILTTIPGASACNNSTQICNVKTLYDQIAGSACNSATCDVTQATVATRPTIVTSCLGSLPCMAFSGSQFLSNASIGTYAQPYSFSSVSERTGAFTSYGDILGFSNVGASQILYANTVNTLGYYNGTFTTATATDSAFHAMQNVVNGPSAAALQIDSSQTTGLSTSNTSLTLDFRIGGDNNAFTGNIAEVYMLTTTTLTTGNMTALNTNEHAYWGF